MTKRFIPLAALAALAALACTPTTVPPAPPSASPSAAASAAASPAASMSPAPAASASSSPAATTSPAASGSPDAEHEVEGCEHMEEGPSTDVTATLVSMSRAAARISDDHKRYDVGLVKSAGQYEGYVVFESAEKGDFDFFLNKDVPIKLMQDGKTIAFEASGKALAACPDVVKAHYVAELEVGQVEVHFGPTTEATVGVVLEHHGGEHDDN